MYVLIASKVRRDPDAENEFEPETKKSKKVKLVEQH
jgi:hypothetical protein